MSSTPETEPKPLSKNELIKSESNYLRGRILQELEDASTGTAAGLSSTLAISSGGTGQETRQAERPDTDCGG